MRALSDLLKNHKIPGIQLREVRNACAKVAAQLTACEILPKQVRVKAGVAYFSVPSVIKSEIHLKETDFKQTMKALGVEISAVR